MKLTFCAACGSKLEPLQQHSISGLDETITLCGSCSNKVQGKKWEESTYVSRFNRFWQAAFVLFFLYEAIYSALPIFSV